MVPHLIGTKGVRSVVELGVGGAARTKRLKKNGGKKRHKTVLAEHLLKKGHHYTQTVEE